MTIIVRLARKDDMQDVLDMIQELADFEKMPDEPKLKVEDLVRDGGFDGSADGAAPLFHCFIAESSEPSSPQVATPAGFALTFNTYSTWKGKAIFMEDLYVKPDYRGSGVGKQLIHAVIKRARDTHCDHVNFHVLDWNPAKGFYEKLNAVNLTQSEEWQLYRLNKEQIHKITAENSN